MNHDELKILVSAYIDGEVTSQEKAIVEDHLQTCADCRKDVSAYMSIASSLKRLPPDVLSPDKQIQIQKEFKTPRRERMRANSVKPVLVTLILMTVVTSSLIWQKAVQHEVNALRGRAVVIPVVQVTAHSTAAPSVPLKKSEEKVAFKPFSKESVVNVDALKMNGEKILLARDATVEGRFRSSADEIGEQYVPYNQNVRALIATDSATGIIQGEIFDPRVLPASVPLSEAYRQQVQDSNTEGYNTINENAFLAAKDNPLSTFSIDVDTASYSNLRRFLNNGQKPPKDAVRIEEMINYFNYHYDQPKDNVPFAIHTEVAACPWNKDHRLALIGLQGKKISTENLPPANLTFLIDVSGSMNEPNKLPLLKSSLKLLVEQMRSQDKVSIVVYAGNAGLVLEPTAGNQKDKIIEAIDRLEAGGSTAGGAGIELAYKTAKEHFLQGGNNRVILATDGDFNVGVSSDAELVRMIEEKRDQGIYLTVLGFGMGNYKDNKMEQLADKGNGNYAYIDQLNEARKVLVNQMGGTLLTIAKDVKIQVEFNPSTVKAYKLIGYENRLMAKEDFNNDKKDASELGSGHTVTALYEVIPADSKETVDGTDPLKYQQTATVTSNDLMTVKLRYKNPTEDQSKLIAQTVSNDQISTSPSQDFQWASAVAEVGLLLRDSPNKGSANYLQAIETAKAAQGDDLEGYRKEFITLIQKAGLLQ